MAIDYPLVAAMLSECLHAGEIGAGAWLTESLAPDFFARQQFGQQSFLELITGVGRTPLAAPYPDQSHSEEKAFLQHASPHWRCVGNCLRPPPPTATG